MAKSSWLTVSPTSGYGNKTIQNIGAAHTGRLQRQTTVTGRAIGIATTKTYTVTQKAKEEFITIGAGSYSVANTGGIVTVSGTSNSPKLTVSVGSGGTLGTLLVNGSEAVNGSDISGDPGATVQYSWSIQIQVDENLTASQRNINVTVTGSSSSVTDTVQIVQAASVFEYIFSIAAGTATIPASGGNSAITAQLTTKRNGEEISTQAVTPTLSGSATGFSISGTTVTAANRGTTVGEARSITVTGKFTTSETGEELTDTAVISQAANSRHTVYGKPVISDVEVADIPASGGSVSNGTVTYSQSRHYYYDSGATEELLALTTGGMLSWGDAVTASSRGATVGDREIAGTLTVTVTMNGQTSVEQDVSVYQEANVQTQTGIHIVGNPNAGSGWVGYDDWDSLPASTSYIRCNGYRDYSYTSGSTSSVDTGILNGEDSGLKTNADWAEYWSNGGFKIPSRGTEGGDARTGEMWWETDGFTSNSLSFTQVANVATYGDVALTASNPSPVSATGGTATISASASQTVSFTSGATRAGSVSIAYKERSAVSGFTLDGNKVTVDENSTTSSRSYVVTVTATGEGSKSAMKDVTVSQASGTITYSDIILNVTYPTIGAGGGTVKPTVSYSQTWGYNGSTTGGGTITSGGDITYSGTNVSTSDGAVTAGTKGTTVSGITTVTTATVEVSLNGKTAQKQVAVQQAANEVTSYGDVTISGGTVSDIPASGGSVSSMSGISASQTITYTSGATRQGSVSIAYSAAVEADSLTTTIKNRTLVGTLTATATGEGSKSATKSLSVYQTGNYVTAVDLTGFAVSYSKSVSAAGGSVSPSVTQGSVKYTFTSGSETTTTPSSTYGSLSQSISYFGGASDGFSSAASSSGVMSAYDRDTTEGDARNSGSVSAIKTVTWTPASNYNSAGTKKDSMSDFDYATQEANVKTAGSISYGDWDVSVSANMYTTSSSPCPASGGTCTITASASRTRTQSYSYTSGATSTEALSNETETPTLSISGTGASLSGTTVTWASRGMTTGSVRQATVTAEIDGVTAEEVVYQEANVQTDEGISYGPWQISVSANRYTTSENACPASGGTCTITRSATRTRTQNYSYTSGATSTEALSSESGTPTLSISGLGALLSGTTVSWENRLTTAGAARQATITATMGDESATEVVYQQANEATLTTSKYGGGNSVPSEGVSSDLSTNFSFLVLNPFKVEWASGSSWEYNMMSPSFQPVPDYVKSLFTLDIDQTSYVGPDWNLIDSIGIALCIEVSENTGSSRPVSATLHFNGANSQDFEISISQEAGGGSYLNVSPASLSFAASGGTKTITIDTNESWTIS